jgi:deoxyhypusine synthase
MPKAKHDPHFSGKPIIPLHLKNHMTASDFISLFQSSGFNARRLGEAGELYLKMLNDDATIWLTLSGALSPIGLNGIIRQLIENSLIDGIVSTGAIVYHDMHFAFGLPVRQGHFAADDNLLFRHGIVRIYDTYIKEKETLQAQDEIVQNFAKAWRQPKAFSTADLNQAMGQYVVKESKHPERSFLAAAAEHDLPVYVPAHADSSIGMNTAVFALEDRPLDPSPSLDILETAAFLYKAAVGHGKSGAVELGGGVPKNFLQQTGPMLSQILGIDIEGQDYLIQMTDARPDTGGLSGATLAEGKSWGKIRDAYKDNVVVYGDVSMLVPLLFGFALEVKGSRRPKRLLKEKKDLLAALREAYRQKKRKLAK